MKVNTAMGHELLKDHEVRLLVSMWDTFKRSISPLFLIINDAFILVIFGISCVEYSVAESF